MIGVGQRLPDLCQRRRQRQIRTRRRRRIISRAIGRLYRRQINDGRSAAAAAAGRRSFIRGIRIMMNISSSRSGIRRLLFQEASGEEDFGWKINGFSEKFHFSEEQMPPRAVAVERL